MDVMFSVWIVFDIHFTHKDEWYDVKMIHLQPCLECQIEYIPDQIPFLGIFNSESAQRPPGLQRHLSPITHDDNFDNLIRINSVFVTKHLRQISKETFVICGL